MAIIELSKDAEYGLNVVSDRNMHRILRFLFDNYGQNDVKKTMLTRFCNSSVLTDCLTKLEDEKLISIEPRKEPQNVFYIRLTPEGMLFELFDLLEVAYASNKTVDSDEISDLVRNWQTKARLMCDQNSSVKQFFEINRLPFGLEL